MVHALLFFIENVYYRKSVVNRVASILSLEGSQRFNHFEYLQLSIFKKHRCLSKGNNRRSMGQFALTVTLTKKGNR